MKDRTNEDSLELFADLLEPASEILSDSELSKIYNDNGTIKAVQFAIRNHKQAVIEILALVDGVKPEEYKVNLLSLPIKVMNFLNRPEFKELFTLQGQTSADKLSGSAMANTEGGVK